MRDISLIFSFSSGKYNSPVEIFLSHDGLLSPVMITKTKKMDAINARAKDNFLDI
jgi:hypothetical protein